MASEEADVGILNANRQQEDVAAGVGAGAGDDNDDASDYVEPSCRWDVYDSLSYANYAGSCCAGGVADGTTLTPALPTTLGLRVNGVGDLPLPLSEWHAKALKSYRNTQKVEDGSWHKTYSVESERIRIKNPSWEARMGKLVQTVAYKLGVDPDRLSAELDLLLFMEKGSCVDRCSNANESQNVLGTLFVQLPSVFTGGKLSIFGGGEVEDDEDEEDTTNAFHLGASGDASFSCHFVAHYKDCEYEFAKIKSGSRTLLRYSLRYEGGQTLPMASSLKNSMSSLKWSLENLPPADRMLLIPMAKKYTALSLKNEGINALAHNHRSHFEAIRAATGTWKLLLVAAELEQTHKTGYYGDILSSDIKSSVVQIFDDEGNDVSVEEKWLKNVVDFESVVEGSDGGMMLADEDDDICENWGACTKTSSSSTYYRDTTTTKRLYNASFILAYDTSFSEYELKCLTGCEGVAEVTKEVVATRNYKLLGRMIKVVESKEKSAFDLRSCEKLVQMMMRSTSRHASGSNRITLVKKVLSGLSPSHRPDVEFYNTILAAVEKFGHDNLAGSISQILSDEKEHELSTFLRRADFILKLNIRLENGTRYQEKNINDLSSFGSGKSWNSDEINSTIFSMLSQHGEETMANVIEAALSFMHRKFSSNRSINKLLNRATLLWKLHDHSYDFIQTCLVDFAEDFARGLPSYYHSTKKVLKGDQQRIFVKAICYVMANGTDSNHHGLGSWVVSSEDTLSKLLEAITNQSNHLEFELQAFLRDILNKCLVHNSTTRSGWYVHPTREDGTAIPSLHVREILKDYPDMPRETDGDGRLPLHHASDSNSASYETIMDIFEANPKAASVRDPVSQLYPFMLAGRNGNTAASFSLLLTNPNLVTGDTDTQVDVADSRKRKRNQSIE